MFPRSLARRAKNILLIIVILSFYIAFYEIKKNDLYKESPKDIDNGNDIKNVYHQNMEIGNDNKKIYQRLNDVGNDKKNIYQQNIDFGNDRKNANPENIDIENEKKKVNKETLDNIENDKKKVLQQNIGKKIVYQPTVGFENEKEKTMVQQYLNWTHSKFRWCSNEFLPPIDLDCHKLFSGDDEQALNDAEQWVSPCIFGDAEAMRITSDCSNLKEEYPFWNEFYRSPYEDAGEEYPLAYVLIGAKSGEQIIRLLQAIYNPRNVYCITYDNKTSPEYKQTFHNLDKCYDNIVMPDKFVNIHWAGFSILQTAMFCLDILRKDKVKWKYVQILSWNDFPLRTNAELVKIMKIFNGAQDSLLAVNAPERTRKYYNVTNFSLWLKDYRDKKKMNLTKNVPPGSLVEYKGSLATTMSREFVEFQFTDSVAKELYKWVDSVYCPEETYWSTLIHNLHINPPGGFPGACLSYYQLEHPDTQYMSRYQLWEGDIMCRGKFQAWSCVYGVKDLLNLQFRPEFMAHKLYMDYQPATLYCLAQLHFNKTFLPDYYLPLDETFYEKLAPVRYQRMKDKAKFNC